MTAQHYAVITLDGGLIIPVESGRLRLDETRAPRITADLVCAATPELLELDPQRDIIWATVTVGILRKKFLRIRDLSSYFASMILGDLSTDYAGKTLADVPWAEPTTSWRLQVRSTREEWASGIVRLHLASCEALLQDMINVGGTDAYDANPYTVSLPTTSITDAVNRVLDVVALPHVTASDTAAALAPSGATATWERGQSCWDKIMELTRARNLIPIPDPAAGTLQLRATSWAPTGTLELTSYGPNRSIIDGGQIIDRDDPDHATVVMQVSRGNVGAFVDVNRGQSWRHTTSYPTWLPQSPWKVLVQTVTTLLGVKAAAEVVQAAFRGRGWEITAICDYSAEPMLAVTVERPDQTIDGVLGAVEFSWPDDQMRLSIRSTLPASVTSTPLRYSDWWTA